MIFEFYVFRHLKSFFIIKENIKSIIEDSTIHGIPRIIQSNSLISKIVWAICFLVSAGWCIYMILTGLSSYLQWNDVTSIEIITEIPARLPMVILHLY